jgi:hypothetical protein
LERLEDRTVPSAPAVFVVPSTTPADSTHFHDLASAVAASFAGDTIQIEPGSVPGPATIGAVLTTIQGDPNYGPSSLPQVGALTLGASNDTLNNLDLSSVTISNGAYYAAIINCLVETVVQQFGSALGNGGDTIDGSTITGSVTLGNAYPGTASNDRVINNTFTMTFGGIALEIRGDSNALVKNNTFTGSVANSTAIEVTSSPGTFTPGHIPPPGVSILNNAIALMQSGTIGISIQANLFLSSATIADNRISTSGVGTGIALNVATGPLVPPQTLLNATVSNNNLVGSFVGISFSGNNTGAVDLGGGPSIAIGGNDFRGYTGMNGNLAVRDQFGNPGSGGSGNIFSTPGSGLDAGHALADRLYDDFLKRSGTQTELDSWAGRLANSNQSSVANGVLRSPEGYAQLVDSLYLKVLGRTADSSGEAYWVSRLQGGATLEQVTAGFLDSTEYAARANTLASAPGSSDSNYVQSLYTLLLGRTGNSTEIDYWMGQLASSNRSAVALGFLGSSEFRNDFVAALYAPFYLVPGTSFVSIVPTLLNRLQAPKAAEIAGWVMSTQDLLTVEGNVASSDEFFTNG